MRRTLLLICISALIALPVRAQRNIERFGRGAAQCVDWNPATDRLAVTGNAGVWLYDSDLQDVAHLDVPSGIDCPEWSPDGRYLSVPQSLDEGANLHLYEVSGAGFSEVLTDFPDKQIMEWAAGRLFMTTKTELLVLAADTLRPKATFERTTRYKTSPTGQRVALIYDERIDIVDLSRLELEITLTVPEGAFTHVAWRADEEQLAAASADRVDVFDLDTREIVFTKITEVANGWQEIYPEGETVRESIGPMSWASDQRTLVVVSQHPVVGDLNTLRVWDTQQDTLIHEEVISRCLRLYWSRNDALLLVSGVAGSGYPFSEAYDSDSWQGIETDLNAGTWVPSPDGETYLSRTYRSDEIRLLDGEDFKMIRSFDTVSHRPFDLAWSPDGSRFASAHGDEVQVWDVNRGVSLVKRVDHISDFSNSTLRWHPDGRQLTYISGSFGLRHTYNQATQRILDTVTGEIKTLRPGLTDPIIWSTHLLEWVADGDTYLLASASAVQRLDARTGRVLRTYLEAEDAYSHVANAVSWNREDGEIAVLQQGPEDTILIINDLTSQISRTIPAYGASNVLWRPRGRLLTLIDAEGWRLVHADTLETRYEASFATEGRPTFYWSPDGRYLATSEWNSLEIWQVSDDGGTVEKQLRIQTSSDHRPLVSWHPDGTHLATGIGTELRVVDASSWQITDTFTMPQDAPATYSSINALAWHPLENKLAVTVNRQPYVYVIDVATTP